MKKPALVTLLTLICCIAPGRVWADIGPKPTIKIELPINLVDQIVSGTLLLCEQQDCSDAHALPDAGPQGFQCALPSSDKSVNAHGAVASGTPAGSCGGLAYGFAPYLQLQLALKEGKTIKSAIFTKQNFDAHFKATLIGEHLTVVEQ